jgi:hypothetical protein
MIKLGFIVPTRFLNMFACMSDYHLVLAHMIRDDGEYSEFYRNRSRNGDFVTLDNSSYELGDGVFDEEDLLDFAYDVEASEIMAPETFGDCDSTLGKVAEFMNELKSRDNNMRIFATAHGSSYSEYLRCIKGLVDMEVDTIGLSCRLNEPPTVTNTIFCNYTIAWTSAFVRLNLMVDVASLFASKKKVPQIHLLGLNHPCELPLQRNYDHLIRSCDSSAAYLSGLRYQTITDFNYIKPATKINFGEERILTDDEVCSIMGNIHQLKGFAGYYDINQRYTVGSNLPGSKSNSVINYTNLTS